MVRLCDLPRVTREHIENLDCPRFETRPWKQGVQLSQRRVAIISSAALIRRGESPFRASDVSFRTIRHDLPDNDILMSHVSVNFDRTGFQEDAEVVLPRRRLDALAKSGMIGSVAAEHYSVMGSIEPSKLATTGREIASRLKADQVDAALLVPV